MDLSENFESVHGKMAAAANRAGRSAEEITLVAVSKTQPPETIRAAMECGQRVFGENRVQEAQAKMGLLPSSIEWHLLGHLQKNKVKHVLDRFALIHSVDSLELAQVIDRLAAERGVFPKVLLEVNLARESTKHGFVYEDLPGQLEDILELDRLQITGLMCIPPQVPKAEEARPHFIKMRELRDRLATEFAFPLPELSMGMSGDYEIAIEEGATIIRVGTALFGPRQGSTWRPAPADE